MILKGSVNQLVPVINYRIAFVEQAQKFPVVQVNIVSMSMTRQGPALIQSLRRVRQMGKLIVYVVMDKPKHAPIHYIVKIFQIIREIVYRRVEVIFKVTVLAGPIQR